MNFESSFKSHLKKCFKGAAFPPQKELTRAVFYSLLAKASRFRPKLCFATAKALGQKPEKILPWAIAIEMIHSASLIHDDLPLMDNARARRGKKAAHLVFGPAMALLAGTGLFIESFALLNDPVFKKKRVQALQLLISKIGFGGLIGGQALDIRRSRANKKYFLKMIQLKTGALIEAAALGPVLLWAKSQTEKTALSRLAKFLGIAYQIADNLKDKDGFEMSGKEAKKKLALLREKSLEALQPLRERGAELKRLILPVYETKGFS